MSRRSQRVFVPAIGKIRLVGVDFPYCIHATRRVLAKMSYVKEFNTDLATGEAIVVYDEDECSTSDMHRGSWRVWGSWTS